MDRKKAKLICITSVKGGVGKTIFTLNLAGVYSRLNKKVLIIDMDVYNGCIATGLYVEQQKDIFNVFDDMSNNRFKTVDDYVVKYNDYIDVIAAPKDPRQGNKLDNKYLGILLNGIYNKYDVVLLDTIHTLNESKILMIEYSDMTFFIVNNDIFDVKNIKSLMAIFSDADFKKYKLILNNSKKDNKYYMKSDIESIVKAKISYVLGKEYYLSNLSTYIEKGNIPSLNNSYYAKNKKTFNNIAVSVFKTNEGSDSNE